MRKALQLWNFIAKRLKARQPVMLLVVTDSAGSSPGRPGFKMAADASGGLCGSIGGGIMEVKLVELAQDRLQKNRAAPLLKRQVHDPAAPRDRSGMICSGEQTVLFFLLENADLTAVRRLLRALKNGRPALLRIDASAGFQVLEQEKNEPFCRFSGKNERDFCFEEILGFANRLYIVGGGHCALALSELAARLDFHISLFDDRPGLNTLNANRFVHKKIFLEHYDRIGALIPEDPGAFVVVMTLGFRSDEIVIRQLLGKNFRYLGLLGSAAKVAALMQNLEKEGFDRQFLQKILAPVGLDINSRTPEEIAVSIAAELIAVKNSEGVEPRRHGGTEKHGNI